MNPPSSPTDDAYFIWQSSIGEFGGWANRFKVEHVLTPEDTVLDFGCGGGYLLKNLNCSKKIGIERNPAALKVAQKNGLEVHTSTSEVPEASVDVVISNHALEHTLHPLQELQDLYRVLKPGGTIVMVVPCESIHVRYRPKNMNHHLYSWSPMALGNLITEAGFTLEESKALYHRWPRGIALSQNGVAPGCSTFSADSTGALPETPGRYESSLRNPTLCNRALIHLERL